MPAILAEGLVKAFGPVRALDGLDIAVPEGSVLGLLGPNGAGKTTAVRVLTTLLRPDAGRATVAGLDVSSQRDQVRRHIGVSGQYAAVDDHLTGRENLVLVCELNQMPRNRAVARSEELLDQFRLTEVADRQVKGYSGGMRRRLDLAGAIVARPKVLFLDEPTTGLDPRSRVDLWDVISDLVVLGTTVLLTTQYLEEADQLADAIAVVDHGRVIARGTADELKAQVGGEQLEVTLVETTAIDHAARIMRSLGLGEVDVDVKQRRLVAPVHGIRTLTDVVQALADRQIDVSDISMHRPTLDDVFLALTGHVAEPTPGEPAPGNQSPSAASPPGDRP